MPVRSSKRTVTCAVLEPVVALVAGGSSVTHHERLVGVELAVGGEQRRGAQAVDGGPRVTRGEDAPRHRHEVRREQHLHRLPADVGERELHLGGVAMREQAVGARRSR